MGKTIVLVVCLALYGCGGGGDSGVPDSAVASDLSAEEAQAVCEEIEFREVDCGGGNTMTLGQEDCSTAEPPPATCTATVGEFRDCFDALEALSDDEICMLEEPPAACDAFFSAECSGQ